MKVILKSLKVLSILFLSIGVLTCEEDDVVLPEVVAEFTYTVNQETGVVSFINTSVNANIYSWDFGDDESSTEVNPSHVYQPGTYTVVLSARNVASPYVTYSDTITIDGSGGGGGGSCTAETTESIAAADLNITFQTNTPAVVEDNTTFSWIDNPDSEGTVNTSCKVGEVVRANNSPFDNIQIDLSDKLDFNASEGLKMKVWSPVANTPVLLKLEEIGNAGNFVEITETTGAANTWTELTYDFDSTATPQFNKMVIFFNFNVADGSTYYFDDLALYGAGGGGSCTAETTESIAAADLNITFQTNTPAVVEDNTTFSWIDNPDSEGTVNTSCKVGEVVRANNSPFDNIQIDLSDKLDFNMSEGLKMKVWSPVANTPVLLKLEEIGNAGNFVEILQTTAAANTWTELTYDFASTATPQFNKMVIFFNFNVADGSTYYFDDLMVYGTGGGGGGPFDGGLITNGDFETGAATPWSGNAANVVDQGGNFVNEANIMSAGNPWDVNLSQTLALEANKTYELSFIAFTDDTTGSRSMIAGIGEAADNFDAVTETPTLTSSPQTFTYQLTVNYNDFANSRVLFDMGAETGFVFIDDVSLFCLDCGGGGGGGTCPAPPAGDFIADGDFEANADCWQLIDNGGTVTISTTVSNGGSNSGQIKTTPGSNPALKQERFGIGTIQPNTAYVVQFDIQANANDLPANGAVFQAFAFSEPAEGSTDGATQHVLIAGDASFPTTWDTRTYTFTTAGNVDGGVSLLLELVCGGVAGCTGTVNIDNVSFTAQ